METLNAVLLLIEKDCYMASIDLQDAYYSINIDDSFRKFLRFYWNSTLYEFTCLPNGLSCAPRIFTKILKPIYENLRQKGLISVYYLDDSWLMGNSFEECSNNASETSQLLSRAGFIINETKSVITPSQHINFLGFCLNSIKMNITLPQEKRDNVSQLCDEISSLKFFKIRFLAKFIGVLVSCLPAVKHGELYYRYLEQNCNNALKKSKGNFDGITSLNVLAWNEVNWWKGCIHKVENDIVIPPPELFITTDASLLGWGAVYEGKSSGGQWNEEESLLHINALELTAIFFGLKSFVSDIYSRHI